MLSKFTKFLKLLFNSKSFKMFFKLIGNKLIRRLGELFGSLWRRRICVKVPPRCAVPVFKVICSPCGGRWKCTFKFIKFLQVFVKFRHTLLEQHTLTQLLRVILVVVVLLELKLLDC